VNRSQSLDHRAGLFPGWLDQGGPSAADRLTSSIGTCCRSRCVVAPRCSLYAKPRILAARRRGSFRPRTGVAKAENRNSASKWCHKARQCRDRVTPIFTPRVFAMTLRASWAYLFAQAVRKGRRPQGTRLWMGQRSSAAWRSAALSRAGVPSALERGGAQGSLDPWCACVGCWRWSREL
jgi:hypothetical protein